MTEGLKPKSAKWVYLWDAMSVRSNEWRLSALLRSGASGNFDLALAARTFMVYTLPIKAMEGVLCRWNQ